MAVGSLQLEGAHHRERSCEPSRGSSTGRAHGRTWQIRSPPHRDKSWQDFANCLGVDPDLFFPERGASTREAKEVCRGCVVREDCLEYALANGEKFGIWGGMSERERRRIRRQRALARRAASAAPSPSAIARLRTGHPRVAPRSRPAAPGGPRSSGRAEVELGPRGLAARPRSTAAGTRPDQLGPGDRRPARRPRRTPRPGPTRVGSMRFIDTCTWSPTGRPEGPHGVAADRTAAAIAPGQRQVRLGQPDVVGHQQGPGPTATAPAVGWGASGPAVGGQRR